MPAVAPGRGTGALVGGLLAALAALRDLERARRGAHEEHAHVLHPDVGHGGVAEVVGISFSSAAYVEYTRQLIAAMREKGVGHVPLILGGMIHPDDIEELKEMGVAALFGAGARTEEIIAFVQSAGAPKI